MRNLSRFVGALTGLCLLALLPGCTSDPAAFLTQAAEAKGRLSQETLGRVAKALDFYCLSVPSMARTALREELASHTAGARLVVTCPGDLSALTPPDDPPPDTLQRILEDRAMLDGFGLSSGPPELLLSGQLRVPLLSAGTGIPRQAFYTAGDALRLTSFSALVPG